MLKSFLDLPFDDLVVRSLPGDASFQPGSRQVLDAAYSLVLPSPVPEPRLLAWSEAAAEMLGLTRPGDDAPLLAEVLTGNRVLPGMRPYAACYGGHQFGNWAGQLGDGRAITLAETIAPDGQRWEIQLKGAGPTPYSRRADGRAVLRSSVREFLCSEAMHFLEVPTTRALALVGTGQPVIRDMFYDGHPAPEPGAVVTRLSPSFIRFGNFEILAARGQTDLLRQLLDFVRKHYFPDCADDLEVYAEVCRRTARLMAQWMRVGFVHGVMNTDNLSILGLTIDYGPYGWLDPYEPHFTPNTTDQGLRYCYIQQPRIAQWNLARLAEALTFAGLEVAALEGALDEYQSTFEEAHMQCWRQKIGLDEQIQAQDAGLIQDLLRLLTHQETDFTLFFRHLARVQDDTGAALDLALYRPQSADRVYLEERRAWLGRWLERVGADPDRARRMNLVNPSLIPRNYLVQQAIDQATAGDLSEVQRLLEAMRTPYAERSDDDPLVQKRPDWARSAPGCSALSCSS